VKDVGNLKFIDAKQAKEIYQYKNILSKLHKTTAATTNYRLLYQPLQFAVVAPEDG
jgi:hypothetical protein